MNSAPASVALSSLRFHGRGLVRPECVLTHRSGLLFTADWTPPGGVAIIDPRTNEVVRHLARDWAFDLKPNGILLDDSGDFLLTHLGDREGGVFRLRSDGRVEPVLVSVEGEPLPPSNFAALDEDEGRLYVTISTRHMPRHLAANARVRDGFIVMQPPDGPARIVADGIGYTNECVLSPDGMSLIVNETFGRRTSVYPVADDGSLGRPETLARFGDGIYPDGLALDEEGGFLVVSIISNTVLRILMDGSRQLVVKDRDNARVEAAEEAYIAAQLDRTILDAPHAGPLKNISSIAFGGPDMRTAYLGCLLGDSIASFVSPVAGVVPRHYDVSLAPLAAAGLLPPTHAEALR